MNGKTVVGIVVLVVALFWFLNDPTYYKIEPSQYVDGTNSVKVHTSVLSRGGFLFEFPEEQARNAKGAAAYASGLASNRNVIVAANEEQAARLRARELKNAAPRKTTSERKVTRQGGVISEKTYTTGGRRKVVVAPSASINKTLPNGLVVTATGSTITLAKMVKTWRKTHKIEVRWEKRKVANVTLNGKEIEGR